MFVIVKDMDIAGIVDIKARLTEDRLAIRAGLEDAAGAVGRAERERLRWVLKADRAEQWRSEGARNMAQYLSATAHVSNWKARRWIEAAYALEALPRTAAALETGTLSLDKVVELARFVTPADESRWISWARSTTTGGVRERADGEVKRSHEEAEAIEATRSLVHWRDNDHVFLQARLPAEQGERVVAAIDKLAETLPSHPDDVSVGSVLGTEAPSIDQRRADALVELITSSGVTNSDTTLVVHAQLDALVGDEGTCSVAGRPTIHPETARRLSCDSKLQTILEDGRAMTVGIGRSSRVVPEWLRRQVLERDGHKCQFPGCETRRHLRIHHVEHWSRGGRTDLDNLTSVCNFHHKLVHEFRWSVALDQRQRPIWFRPSGRVYEPGPAPPIEIPEPKKEPPRLAEAISYSRLLGLAAVL